MPGVRKDYRSYHRVVEHCRAGGFFGEVRETTGWTAETPHWGTEDAAVFWCMLRRFRPRRVIEIGSGRSSLMIRDALDKNDLDARDRELPDKAKGREGRGDGGSSRRGGESSRAAATATATATATAAAAAAVTAVAAASSKSSLTCIDPEPRQGLDRARGIRLLKMRMQQVNPRTFFALQPGDLLSLDGSHVADWGSDVAVTITEILPRLRPGVLVHIHDITLPRRQVEVDPMGWNEQSLVHAFLLFNTHFDVLFPSNEIAMQLSSECTEFVRGATGLDTDWERGPGSFWLKRRNESTLANTPLVPRRPQSLLDPRRHALWGVDRALLDCNKGWCQGAQDDTPCTNGRCCPTSTDVEGTGGTLQHGGLFKSHLAGIYRDYDGFARTLSRCRAHFAEWNTGTLSPTSSSNSSSLPPPVSPHARLRRMWRRHPELATSPYRWSLADLALTWCMHRIFRPRRVLEIGSGSSSVLVSAAFAANAESRAGQPATTGSEGEAAAAGTGELGDQGSLTCLDPSPHRNGVLRFTAAAEHLAATGTRMRWVEQRVAKTAEILPYFLELQHNDIIHVNCMQARLWTNDDITALFLEVLPRVAPGVLVNFHGIMLPAGVGKRRPGEPDWLGQIFLQAFL